MESEPLPNKTTISVPFMTFSFGLYVNRYIHSLSGSLSESSEGSMAREAKLCAGVRSLSMSMASSFSADSSFTAGADEITVHKC